MAMPASSISLRWVSASHRGQYAPGMPSGSRRPFSFAMLMYSSVVKWAWTSISPSF